MKLLISMIIILLISLSVFAYCPSPQEAKDLTQRLSDEVEKRYDGGKGELSYSDRKLVQNYLAETERKLSEHLAKGGSAHDLLNSFLQGDTKGITLNSVSVTYIQTYFEENELPRLEDIRRSEYIVNTKSTFEAISKSFSDDQPFQEFGTGKKESETKERSVIFQIADFLTRIDLKSELGSKITRNVRSGQN